ncbi:MAG: methyltransferase domain-containing protein [Alphaproteobacteria bacterium]|nr:methyltransferase domain-containing protein [Alphaproteobacteria bacterium]
MTEKKPRTFDSAASARVDRIYQNPDVVAQRVFVRDRLALRPGDAVIDVGAGPGLLALEMASEVGPNGRVIALDPSADMRGIAEQRCQNTSWVTVTDGDATALPVEDATLDAVVATQVFEYVPDMALALKECLRVLKPGGRLLALDTDWDSAVVNTADRKRMALILEAWRPHFFHSDLPGRLPSLIRDGGFTLQFTGGTPVVNTSMDKDTYAGDVIYTIAKYAERKSEIAPEICAAWLKEMTDLDAAGQFFFSITRFLFLAIKPT